MAIVFSIYPPEADQIKLRVYTPSPGPSRDLNDGGTANRFRDLWVGPWPRLNREEVCSRNPKTRERCKRNVESAIKSPP